MTVPGFPRTLITLPLLALGLALVSAGHAAANGKAAEEAVRLLSKARAADQRCNYLSGAERSELSRFTARAELAAASQSGPKAARQAGMAGATEGAVAACGPALQADVRETYEAARAAMAQAAILDRAKAAPPAARPARQKPAKTAAAEPGPASGGHKPNASLAFYERAVRAYYLERECRSLPKASAGRFWEAIVRLHKVAVAANGAGRVAPVMHNAERRARASSCGGRAMAEIRRGYDEIVSR